jgi:hypothetical protein
MGKRFDSEDEPNEFMEMPCRCDCGKWFDLHDGYNSNSSNKIICADCKEDQDSFHYGDKIIFKEDCYINGRLRVYAHNKGTIVTKLSIVRGEVSINVDGHKRIIHNVPTWYLIKQ